jgi:ribosomal protein L13E
MSDNREVSKLVSDEEMKAMGIDPEKPEDAKRLGIIAAERRRKLDEEQKEEKAE